MVDIFSKNKRSEIMSKIKAKETKLEIRFRKELWRAGFRYRKNAHGYYGKPDVLLKKYKTVIFIDSCFWHGCKKHFKLPATKKEFWKIKIERNKQRDNEVNRYYKKNNWIIIRIWEHQLRENKNFFIEKIIKKIKMIN
ncbi:MAG TPA: very short patch repair endonuclease [Candidatus Moranbacteria bacterium]|nr:MAG: mismatch endonuclease Vsr protein [Candidatus Moranbacteria bacterium GW2011_GWF1_34_10]HBI17693.1 very short patch repair endonuclease [Candidatus Moranbacteria bacterium]